MTKFTKGKEASLGMDIMRRISDGQTQLAPAEDVERIKQEISENCEELIEIGARIRPLMCDGKQIGWVRGIHSAERKIMRRWVRDPNDYVAMTILHATTFTKEEIEAMQGLEIRSIVEVIKQMSNYDLSLYPYLAAYVTTSSSEALWYGKGEDLTSFDHKVVTMPDGKKMTIMAPPDHSRLWATLCNYREQAKKRLEDNFNSLFIVRPWAGKGADPIAHELKNISRQLETNSNHMWEQVVRVPRAVDKNDGWGHPGDTVDDLIREMKGMMEGDKHERLMDAWQKQMVAEAEAKKKAIEEARKKRGVEGPGISAERTEVLTDAQVKARQAALRAGKMPGAVTRRETYEKDSTDLQIEKISKYR
jgi:hypothetical protein